MTGREKRFVSIAQGRQHTTTSQPSSGEGFFFLQISVHTYPALDDSLLDPLIFRARLDGHAVHAALAAVVARIEPILLHAPERWVAPREEVAGRKKEWGINK